GVVEGRDLHQVVGRVPADVHLAGFVVDVERLRVDLPLPARRLQQLAVHEDHVVVEAATSCLRGRGATNPWAGPGTRWSRRFARGCCAGPPTSSPPGCPSGWGA